MRYTYTCPHCDRSKSTSSDAYRVYCAHCGGAEMQLSGRHGEPLKKEEDGTTWYYFTYAQVLRNERDKKGITLSALAEKTGIGMGRLALFEHGGASPSYAEKERIARALGLAPRPEN